MYKIKINNFSQYRDAVKHCKNSLELGIAKWTEFDEKHAEALKWLNEKETLIQSFNKLQSNLEEKRAVLEQFQGHLQTLFDWQRDLDNLNISAQTLLEICADTRISNAITQLTTKYNAILSLAKEIMKRLELHYQEHQQHNALYTECEDWLDKIKEKLSQCTEIPNSLNELNSKLNSVKGIRQSLEQGQNKLRYVVELKEKVILNTEANGASKIEEDTENLKQEFEKLLADVTDVRQKLTNRLNQLEEISKQYKILREWLGEVDLLLQADEKLYNELSDKKAALEKLRVLQREAHNYNEICLKIENKLKQDNIDGEEFKEGLNHFSAVQEALAKKIQNLENQVNDHEKYKQSYNETYNWIRNTKKDIQECSDSHGEKDLTLNKLSKLKSIDQSMPEGKVLMSNTIELSKNLIALCDSEGQDVIKEEIKQMETDWQELEILSKNIADNLNDCIACWNKFANKSEEINKILNGFRDRIAQFDGITEMPSDEVINNAKVTFKNSN